ALATRIYESAEIRIAVDIGTNGEALLGSRDRLWACSAPAGPALEGAQIRHGMRGALGAIDRVTVDDDLHVHTIGEADALGICGSGLIDLVAGLLDARVAELMLAGGFGNYVSIASALRIGLIPPLPVERIRYVGNAAALGAQLCLVSETERRRAESVAARIEHVSLAAHPDFERIFVE